MSSIYTPKKIVYRYNDPFFEEGNIALRSIWLQKEAKSQVEIDIINEQVDQLTNHFKNNLFCEKCEVELPNILSYELHYEAIHRNVCSVCYKIFPGYEWLQLHLNECHDVILQMKKERGDKIHACFIKDCKELFLTDSERQSHLIMKHKYPEYFPFDLIYTGTLSFEERKLREAEYDDEDEDEGDIQMEELTGSISKLRLPTTVSFGYTDYPDFDY